jgi:2-polyprenyl-6-hydroxyphenyl methylase/3-demethylubiquinone-9 3-methyltransferase
VATCVQDDVRFPFGKNWRSYARRVDAQRVHAAERSLTETFGSITGQSFLDIGSGSGLFSLAARRLGADVVSFDYDPESVRCAEEMRDRYRPEDVEWQITQGSVLDREFMESLGQFEVVYSYGVLHHTGQMWTALALACERTAPGGRLYVALYNDQGRFSQYWRAIKRAYNQTPMLQGVLTAAVLAKQVPQAVAADVARGQTPFVGYRSQDRGMSIWHDWIDWIGGYSFEVAQPGDVFAFLRDRGLHIVAMRTTPGSGNNEYLAVASPADGRAETR